MGMSAGDPIVIFGAGAGGRRAATHLSRARDVRYFVDSDPRKHGTRVMDREVRPPQAILATPGVSVIVASIHADAIFTQLLKLGVPAHRIEIINPDSLVDGGKDPFPTGIALLASGIMTAMTAAIWWVMK
jgi:hypothetical protein